MKVLNNRYIRLILLAFLSLALLFPACSSAGSSMNGSGHLVEQDYKVSDFDAINVKGPFKLDIIEADAFKVTAGTDDNLIKRLQITLERRSLNVRIEAPANFFPTSLTLRIEMPDIASLNLSEGVKASITGFTSIADFVLFLSDESSLTGDLAAIIARFHLSKSATLSLKGSAMRLEMEGSASKIDLETFRLANAQIKLSQTSEATLFVDSKLDVTLNDESKVYYLGNPLISNTFISGGSSMVHK